MSVEYEDKYYPNMLRVFRQNAGYKQIEVAKLLGFTTATVVCSWENDNAIPNGENLIRLCVLYNKQVSELYPKLYHRAEKDLLS